MLKGIIIVWGFEEKMQSTRERERGMLCGVGDALRLLFEVGAAADHFVLQNSCLLCVNSSATPNECE